MNELQEIEARLKERRAAWAASDPGEPSEIPPSLCFSHLTQAESDLDATITHLLAWDAWFLEIVDLFISQGEERKQARADARKYRTLWDQSGKNDLLEQLAYVRADVVRSRKVIMRADVDETLAFMADTEHYEQYR